MIRAGATERALIVGAAGLALWATLGSFAPGPLASWDGPAHVVRAGHFTESVDLERLGIFGVYDGWYLGVPLFLFYPPGFFALSTVLRVLCLGLVDTDTSVRLAVALVYAAFPAAIDWLGRKLGLPARAAAWAGFLSILPSAGFGVGLAGLYSIGLFTQALGLLMLALLLGLVAGSLEGERRFTACGVVFAAIVLTNIPVAVLGALALSLQLAVSRAGIRTRARLAATVLVVGLALSAFWLVPFWGSRELFGQEAAFSGSEPLTLLAELGAGRLLVPSWFVALALLGSVVGLRRHGSPAGRLLTGLFLLFLGFGSSLPSDWAAALPAGAPFELLGRVLRTALRARALAGLWLALPLLAGLGLHSAGSWLAARGRPGRVLALVLSAAALWVGVERLDLLRVEHVRTVTHAAWGANWEEWKRALGFLKRTAEPGAVVLTDIRQRFFALRTIGTISIDSLLNLEAGVRSVRGNQIEATLLDGSRLDGVQYRERAEDEDELRRFGVDYVLAWDRPSSRPSYLETLYTDRHIAIHRVVGRRDVVLAERAPNLYRFRAYRAEAGVVELPVQFNDHWSAESQGRSLEARRSSVGLVSVVLPPGVSDVTLRFAPFRHERVAFLFSLVAGALAVVAGRRRELPRRRTGGACDA
jgi:hypothetical protein